MGPRNGLQHSRFGFWLGSLAVLSSALCGGCGAPYTTSLLVTPATKSVALGDTVQFFVTAWYSDGSSKDVTRSASWTTMNSSVATVSSTGLATSLRTGNAAIMATVGDVSSAANLTVSSAALTGISISAPAAPLAVGLSTQLRATGTYTDKSVADVTDLVAWSAAEPSVLSINSGGMAVARAAGNTQISASLNGFKASAQVTVSPAALASIAVGYGSASLPLGRTEQLSATGTYTDGSTRNLSASAAWTSASPGIISVTGSGLIQARSVGKATVSASVFGTTGTATLTASAAQLVSIAVSPTSSNLPLGETMQLSATGTFTDGTTQDLTTTAEWTSSSPAVAGLRGAGLITGLAVGAADVAATSGTVSGATNLTVSTAAVSSLTIMPTAPSLPLGSILQLSVTGTYSDGSTQDLTSQVAWNVTTPTIASISAGGLVTATQIGITGVQASLPGVQASATLTVQPLLAIGYFASASGADSTIRITNPALTGQDLCAMVYVFDQDQQMSECCGCLVSQDGLLTLSLNRNLLSNPLTGVPAQTGTVMLVPAAPGTVGSCNAASITPAGSVIAWSTHLPAAQAGQTSSAEEPFSSSPLASALSASLQAQCAFIQELGSGQGLCGCGGSQN